MPVELTSEQEAAVKNRGGGLLISAAAGSGKTRVLVERLLSRVTGEGIDIDRFLVITFTNAAAAELRSRIVDELSVYTAENPGDSRLRRQNTLVYKADISTIHAFCIKLLRECGHLLDIDPDFRLCDEGESGVLMLRALNDVMDKRYEDLTEGSDFTFLVDTMSAGRDDSRLMQIVLDIRGRVQAHPNPAAWLDKQERAFDLPETARAEDTPWGRRLLEDARQQAAYWVERMAAALDLCAMDEKLDINYSPTISATLDGLRRFIQAAANGWDSACACMPIPFPKPGMKPMKDCPEELSQQVKDIRSKCSKRMDKLAEWFEDSSAGLMEDLRAVHPTIRGLFALVRDFEAAYTAEKQRRSVLDYSDLEHLAVKLLVDENGAPTELAEQWSQRYEEIMVDEYQDTNEVQNAIFSAISRQGRNLFMVGDVKQSIYSFRLADPTIFLGKYRRFKPYTQAADGENRYIVLSKNFRSRPQVLEAANDLFRSIMSEELGEMDYTAEDALYPGPNFALEEGNTYAVELNALDCSSTGEEEGPDKAGRDLLEARFTAQRIRELLDSGYLISDGKGTRPVRYGDMVILMRSPSTVLHHYARALGEYGIPWEAEGRGDFFAATEVSVALSLLQIVDNPRQDVPLISVLRSPVYGFSADRLAQIRAAARDEDFYTALEREGGEDAQAFLTELNALRFGAGDKSSHQLLWHIYDSTNLLGVFGAMDEGEARQSNLLTLAELARQFEGAGHRGLFGFLSFLSRLRENKAKLTLPTPGREGGGVRIMTIHKSKGLEFPIVFLCGLSRRLNREDVSRPILFDPKLGVGPKRLDLERGIEYPTLARMAVARKMERGMMAEEMRLLYVAMTRAKEKLIMNCALTRGSKDLERLAGDAGNPVDPQVLMGCQSVGQWVLLSALTRPEAGNLRAAAGVEAPITAAALGPAWDIRFVSAAPFQQAPERQAEVSMVHEEEPLPPSVLAERLCWRYPQAGDVAVPSKITATQLKGRGLDQEAAENAPPPPRERTIQRPRFAAEEFGLTPAQRGTAQHLAMQYIDFNHTGSVEAVRGEVRRLVDENFLTPQQGEAVRPEKIAAFFASPLGQEMLASPTLRREFKFSLLVPAADYYPEAARGEQVLLQGVVDCCFETLLGVTVVDFKTDHVNNSTVMARAAEYRPQLAAYSRALADILGKPIVRRVLWFFALDRAVEI